MFDELVELVFPGGAFIALGVAVGAAFGKQLRPVAKEVVKFTLTVAEQVQGAAAEASERAQDLIAEAKHEQQAAGANGSPVRSPRRATSKPSAT
jgi:hypothetical protein